MKTKEQKRREAYERQIATAQAVKKDLDRWRALCDSPKGRNGEFEDTRKRVLLKAHQATRQVFEFHNRFGYPLPDLRTIYCP